MLLQLKSHIEPHTLIVGDLNTPLLAMGRSSSPKLNREIMVQAGVIKLMDLTDIYRTSHLNT